MPTPLKRRELRDEEANQQHETPKFQEFQELNSNSAKLKELLFFTRIALFSVSTVVVAFFLLVLGLAPIWSFLFAGLIGLAITSAISAFIWSLKR